MIVARRDGPAMKGTAIGMMKGSWCKKLWRIFWVIGNSTCMEKRNKISPEQRFTEIMDKLKISKKKSPKMLKRSMIPKAKKSSLSKILYLFSEGYGLKILANEEAFPNASIIKNKINVIEVNDKDMRSS